MSQIPFTFAVASGYQAARRLALPRPYFGIVPVTWDDFGSSTLHQLYFFPEGRTDEFLIGNVKIMKSGTKRAHLSSEPFTKLEPSQISVGQDLMYYKNLRQKVPGIAKDVLIAMNDIAWRKTLADQFEHEHTFINSLIRSNDARAAFQYGRYVFLERTVPEKFSFSYVFAKTGAPSPPLVAKFNFARHAVLPWRICAIIGKNGVGKTQLLSRLAVDLVQETEVAEGGGRNENIFVPAMPIFSRVIALSFSAFDQFVRPADSEYVSYFYCGVTDKNGRVSLRAIKEHFISNIEKIERTGGIEEYAGYLLEILEKESIERESLTSERARQIVENFDPKRISSGQGLAAFSVAAIMANVKENALILFDEPELHLHPNAIATLMRILHEIVERQKAFAILATHSPLVIREIPSRSTQRFERYGSIVAAEELETESLGEDVSELTRQVFETVAIPSPYKDILRNLSEEYTFEEALKIFKKGLSLHATAFLAAQYQDEDK